MAGEPEGGRESAQAERLAKVEKELRHLKAGLELLGAAPCGWCGVFYRRNDPALFHCGEFVCYGCIPAWWLHRSPELSTHDRPKVENELRHWLVSNHHAHVIGKLEDLPPPDRLLMKLVTGCGECNSTGKNDRGKRCSTCDGRGTVWVVISTSDF